LLKKLLDKDPAKRLGSSFDGFKDIMNHAWFKKIDWMNIKNKKVKSPYEP